MIAQNFDQANKTLTAPPGQENRVYDLRVWCDNRMCVSCWKPTWRELWRLLRGHPVWLTVVAGHTQPPVALEVARSVFRQEKQNDG